MTDSITSKYIIFFLLILSSIQPAICQHYSISGRVIDNKSKVPMEFVTVYLPENTLWAITNEKGAFTLHKVPAGKIKMNIQYLGYVTKTLELDIQKNITDLLITLQESNLTINEVVVTAQKRTSSQTTSYTIDRRTLDHAQMLNLSGISTLLPGGKTIGDQNLTSDKRISLQSGSGEFGNASFGTAVTIDGVQLQNNAAMNETKGIDLRNIGSSNIESVEVITGIPSVEYGDMSNGIVKINTRKGKTPFIIELATEPKTKQFAISKGFLLGNKTGTLNTSFERTRSTSNLASPHTAYDRNTLTLNYSNILNRNAQHPLSLNAGLTGNIGGYNSKADPDAFQDTYIQTRDYTFRGNVKLDWLLNKSWITNLSLSASMAYSDKLSKESTNKNSASTQPFIHSTQEGYFIATSYDENPNAEIILGPTGYWYQLAYTDSKPINYAMRLKAAWSRQWNNITNKLMLGTEINSTGNKGRGLYYNDMRYAPTWRQYRYDELPFLNNIATYIEDNITLPVGRLSSLHMTVGLRSDITYIKNSEYQTANSLSPRFNIKYTVWKKADKWVSDLSVYGGIGKSVKLPSFEVLYPSPSYSDKLAFAPGTMSDGTTFYAYYSIPSKAIYNPDLKWQYTRQTELGLEANVKGTRIYISAFHNKTFNPYMRTNEYTPYTYKLTTQEHLNNCEIPSANRYYSIDRQTGVVTVSDRTGTYASQQLAYNERNTFKANARYTNGSPVTRSGINWIVDFAQIQSLRTSFRLDGNYYYYKGIDETLVGYMPSNTTMADGNPYKYVGYYCGSNETSTSSSATASVSNGSLSRQLNMNLTVTTHIPKIRMILSMRVEGSFYNYRQSLSEYSDGSSRGIALENAGNYFSNDPSLYGRDKYVAVYPLYYSTWEEPNIQIPFAEKFAWAKENDTALYNELAKLVVKSNTSYYFNPNRISSYFSANINLTKEIGDFASISFYATNFFNHMGRVKSSQTGLESTLYNSSYIPQFYYGLSVKLKL
ncbi:TonB-dependent receptor domain-containing protein [Bacteroides helcogenes]|uniref:TonB-dependent receptor n=1 Tax=Bacteroides helcogenes (strain ATCC 35417 / DSM 20613 / JCM 6297 / CCUG 15421 / P 36-108) TaxID=693979 RepID=E6SS34_BACT6|nr:TonB-dependent receptor [Bacteroides helcogenes]ADV43136.1 TonB-dependent receptor [Bacteroides helcogenes P 36-108]MDY5239114.1 TonB-dependent receptor [Bacteroides helcogenes]